VMKHHRIMLIAGIGVMQQGHIAIRGDHHRQAQQAKVVAPLFAMTALGQLGAQVETVQKGKEIGGVK
jgi:hypothetical protein